MTRSSHRRGTALAAVASTGLVLGTLAFASPPAQSADPVGDCTPAAVASSVTKGQEVTGMTVDGETASSDPGTTPTDFSGTVLGTIHDGIAPGVDMIVARLSSPAIDRVGGIWAGMSGSPVYDGNGKLIGAVAYGLSWGPSPVAGITPYEDMDAYMGDPATQVRIPSAMARTIAAKTDVTQAQAEQGAHQLQIPMSVSGISQARIAKAMKATKGDRKQAWLHRDAAKAAGTSGVAEGGPGADTITAGGNLAAAVSTGDVTMGAVGTATEVCDGKVVGFGHPFTFSGDTSLAMLPADALYVQEDSLGSPFKVANLGDPVGTVFGDHLTGITGSFGDVPDGASISNTTSYHGASRTGSSEVYLDDYTPDVAFYQVLANHDRVMDRYGPGSEAQTWTITGDDNGTPFSVDFDNRYVSQYDIAFESIWTLPDTVYALQRIPGVTITDVTSTSDVADDTAVLKLSKVQQKTGGSWTTLSRRGIKAMPGDTLKLRAVLTAPDGTVSYLTDQVTISRKARDAFLAVRGGGDSYVDVYGKKSVSAISDALDSAVRGDEVSFGLYQYGRKFRKSASTVSAPQAHVVDGRKYVPIRLGGAMDNCRGC